MTPVQILRVLSKHPDNTITAFHRALRSVGGVFTGGGATAGVTLNYFDPYYSWRNYPESVSIKRATLKRLEPFLISEPWGDFNIGGTIYKLSNEYSKEKAEKYFSDGSH